MPTRAELIVAISELADSLNQVSQWYNHGNEPFGHIENDTQTSYIFEFYCYIRYVNELANAGNRVTFNNTGALGSFFPKAPAEKNNGWAKFELKDRNDQVIYDVCAGVNIRNHVDNYTYAADISIQSPVQIPRAEDTFLIVDGKFKNDATESLPIGQLREFRAALIDLGFPKAPPNLILEGTPFERSSIVTNGQINEDQLNYSNAHHFNQIGNFNP